MIPTTDEELVESEVVEAIEDLGATEQAIKEEIGVFIGEPDRRQKDLSASLARLYFSLRGPEKLLDSGSYSRPFPPPMTIRNTHLRGF